MKKILSLAFLIVVSCSPKSEDLFLPIVRQEQNNLQVEDPNMVYFDPSVDILFVVDNSGSMGTHQKNLIKNINLFTEQFLTNSVLNYNIGVLTTDMNREEGELISTGGVTFVNRKTPNSMNILRSNLNLGTNGSGIEKVFDPVFYALDKHINVANKGFYRPNATLVLIFVTDAEDQSSEMDEVELRDFLVKLKKGDSKKIISLGVIVPSSDVSCVRDEQFSKPVRIEKFLNFFPILTSKTNILNLCSTDYGRELSSLAESIVTQIGNVIYLAKIPVEGSLRVTYGAIDLPNDYKTGWVFKPVTNTIELGSEIDWESQPSGSRIQVFYKSFYK